MTKRYRGHNFAPNFVYPASKKLKERAETYAGGLMFEVVFYLHEYDALTNTQLFIDIEKHIHGVQHELYRSNVPVTPPLKFQQAAHMIDQLTHDISNISELVAREVIETIQESRKAYQLKRHEGHIPDR